MGKRPAFLFYPSDWTRDLDDHELEIEGAWIRICCRLYWEGGESTKTLPEWARILRKTNKKTEKIIKFLLDKDIASGTYLDKQNITIISRRIKRDIKISQIRQEAGKLGGNPKLTKNAKTLVNQSSNQTGKQNLTPSVSVSSSVSGTDSKTLKTLAPSDKKTSLKATPQNSKPLLGILLKTGDEFYIYNSDIAQWKETFPNVNIMQELREIRQWNIDNPGKRKTKAGIRRHISGWLSDEQDKGNAGENSQGAPPRGDNRKSWETACDDDVEKIVAEAREKFGNQDGG